MPTDIMRTGLQAWNALGGCGLEPKGRDVDFVEALRVALKPDAADLTDALEDCSSEQFLRAFLATAAPFVKMLQGILRMFERGGANVGSEHWKLAFDDFEETLEHFKQWESIFQTIGTHLSCPAVTVRDWWMLMEILRQPPIINRVSDNPNTFWDMSKRDFTLTEPTRNCLPWMHDLFALLVRSQQWLQDAGLDLLTVRNASMPHGTAAMDAFSPCGFFSLQHDYQVSQLVASYEVLLKSPLMQRELDKAVSAHLGPLPRLQIWLHAEVEELRPFLQLPVWQKRYEFYAAWVAAEQIDVFWGQSITVHSDKGKISFPFRETLIATLHDAPWKLISERRTSLENPAGKGRSNNVQPDYGWWYMDQDGHETCGLVTEVKHYKKASRRSWADVLNDYARAHDKATVVLVNYGPTGHALGDVAEKMKKRCYLIGNLHPNNPASIAEFRTLVAQQIGAKPSHSQVLMLDVSSSMNLLHRQLSNALNALARAWHCEELLAVDVEIIERLPAGRLQNRDIAGLSRQRAEHLADPLLVALSEYDSVILVSDISGYQTVCTDSRFIVTSVSAPELDKDLNVCEIRLPSRKQLLACIDDTFGSCQ